MKKTNTIVKIINPSLKVGTVIENRYKVIYFKEINEWSGGDGLVEDIYENNKRKKIEDVYNLNWSEPKQYKKIEEIAELMNKIDSPNVKCERFARYNGILYRICMLVDESNELHDKYSLYKRIDYRIKAKQKFTEQEIVEFVFWAVNILKYLNNIGLDYRSNINHGKFQYQDSRIIFSTFYFDLTNKFNRELKPPYNISMNYLWLLGGIIYEMATLNFLTNRGPFFDMDDKQLAAYQYAKIKGMKNPRLPEFPREYSLQLIELYERLIEVIPEKRPTIDEILNADIMNLAHESLPCENWSGKNDLSSWPTNIVVQSYNSNSNNDNNKNNKNEAKSSFCNII